MLSQHRYVNTYLDPHVINYVQGNPCVIIYVRVINYVQGESTCNDLGSGGSTIGVNNTPLLDRYNSPDIVNCFRTKIRSPRLLTGFQTRGLGRGVCQRPQITVA